MAGIDRTEILRIDCNACSGRGYKETPTGQESCETCGGSGMLEKEVPFRHDIKERRSVEEVAEIFGIPVEQVKDKGHDAGAD